MYLLEKLYAKKINSLKILKNAKTVNGKTYLGQ